MIEKNHLSVQNARLWIMRDGINIKITPYMCRSRHSTAPVPHGVMDHLASGIEIYKKKSNNTIQRGWG